ncbi:hypothetical protein REPUB_Repub15cG0089300 [Reevesia pubescens]
MKDGLSSFWGPVTTTKWCEKNYVHSSYIAEFFNRISNVPSFFLALIGLINALRQRFCHVPTLRLSTWQPPCTLEWTPVSWDAFQESAK